VNEAVERAHCEGVLSAASLMIGAPAAEDAVERARSLPSLGVGLHLTLIDGRPVLPPDKIPGLVGPDGRFFSNPFRIGLALYVSSELRRQADAEINAQFERFLRTGLRLITSMLIDTSICTRWSCSRSWASRRASTDRQCVSRSSPSSPRSELAGAVSLAAF
jgi:predicted glycoside hydrolase/deacetylase ChbG (UPF0249 family)